MPWLMNLQNDPPAAGSTIWEYSKRCTSSGGLVLPLRSGGVGYTTEWEIVDPLRESVEDMKHWIFGLNGPEELTEEQQALWLGTTKQNDDGTIEIITWMVPGDDGDGDGEDSNQPTSETPTQNNPTVKDISETFAVMQIDMLDEKDCRVCYLDYGASGGENEGPEQPVQVPCGHIFGSRCIEKWLPKSNTCPICRTPLIAQWRYEQVFGGDHDSDRINIAVPDEDVEPHEDSMYDEDIDPDSDSMTDVNSPLIDRSAFGGTIKAWTQKRTMGVDDLWTRQGGRDPFFTPSSAF